MGLLADKPTWKGFALVTLLTNSYIVFVRYLQSTCEPLARDFFISDPLAKGFWTLTKGLAKIANHL